MLPNKQRKVQGQCEAIPNSELIIATDASRKRANAHSGAYIATTGKWGWIAVNHIPDLCRLHCWEAMELRATWYALKAHRRRTNITFLVDSQNAFDHLQRWQEGDIAPPHWYNTNPYVDPGRKPALVILQEIVTAHADSLRFVHVEDNNRDFLNRAADGLAGIGTNWLTKAYDIIEAKNRSAMLATSFLLDYTQTQNP